MAISSPLSSLASTAKDTSKKTVSISRVLTRSIQTKKNLYASKKLFSRRRNENAKRAELRDRFLAPILVTRSRGPRRLALTDTSTSVSDRLLGFIGYLSAGWILSNMPTWIRLGEQFFDRLIVAGRILSNYGDESIRVMEGISNVFGAALENISRFDFTDSSYLVRSSLNDLKDEIDALGIGLSEAFAVLLKPFKDIPELGTIQPDEPSKPPSPGTALPDPKSAEMYRIAAALSTEGSGKQSVVDMMQVVVNRKASGAYGKTYTAVLAAPGQFAGVENRGTSGFLKIQTLKDASRWSGQSENALLGIIKNIQDPSLQSNAARFVGGALEFRGSPATIRAVNSDSNPKNNIQADANGRIPGSVWRGGNGDNQFLVDQSRGDPMRRGGAAPFNLPAPQAPSSQQPPIAGQRRLQKGDIFTKSLGKGVDYIQITSLVGDDRNHGGIDVAAPSGTYIALRVDCEVVAQGTYGNYGLLIDVWVPSLGIQLRMTHLSSVLIKSGKIPAGTSFARVGQSGRAFGPHIHLEYDTKKGMRGGGALNDDPANYAAKLDQYVRLLLLTKNPNNGKFSPASTPSISLVPNTPSVTTNTEDQVEMGTNSYLTGLLNGITQERKGRKIVIIDDRSMGGVQQIISSGGEDDLQIEIPKSALLNNFIKNKLLLDLTYV